MNHPRLKKIRVVKLTKCRSVRFSDFAPQLSRPARVVPRLDCRGRGRVLAIAVQVVFSPRCAGKGPKATGWGGRAPRLCRRRATRSPDPGAGSRTADTGGGGGGGGRTDGRTDGLGNFIEYARRGDPDAVTGLRPRAHGADGTPRVCRTRRPRASVRPPPLHSDFARPRARLPIRLRVCCARLRSPADSRAS